MARSLKAKTLRSKGARCSCEGWYGSPGAQLHMVVAASWGVSRSGLGMFRPHLYTSGSVVSSKSGLHSGNLGIHNLYLEQAQN